MPDEEKPKEYQVMMHVGSEPRFIGTMPPREDVALDPMTPEQQAKWDKIFTPDAEGYFHTDIPEDHPMLGKGDEHFAPLLGMSAGNAPIKEQVERKEWREQTPEEIALVQKALDLGAFTVRIIPADTPEYCDAHSGRLHIYLDKQSVVRKVHYERIYCKWKMADEPAQFIFNAKALSRLTLPTEP